MKRIVLSVALFCSMVALALAGETLQEHLDAAWEARDELVLEPGRHLMTEPLKARCSIRGVGDCTLDWRGGKTDTAMLTVTGTPGQLYKPNIANLIFNCRDKAPGLLIDNVQSATIEDIMFYRSRGVAMKVKKGWTLHVRNIRMIISQDSQGFIGGLTGGSLNGLVLWKMKSSKPLVVCSGVAVVQALTIEDCDSGDSPAILLNKLRCGELSAVHTERLRCSAIVEVRDTFGALVRGMNCRQLPGENESKANCAVSLVRCRDTEIKQIDAVNIVEAVVRVGPDCVNCRVWGVWKEEASWIIPPRHLIDFVGRIGKETP